MKHLKALEKKYGLKLYYEKIELLCFPEDFESLNYTIEENGNKIVEELRSSGTDGYAGYILNNENKFNPDIQPIKIICYDNKKETCIVVKNNNFIRMNVKSKLVNEKRSVVIQTMLDSYYFYLNAVLDEFDLLESKREYMLSLAEEIRK